MMGIAVPETCWAYHKYNKTWSSIKFLYFSHLIHCLYWSSIANKIADLMPVSDIPDLWYLGGKNINYTQESSRLVYHSWKTTFVLCFNFDGYTNLRVVLSHTELYHAFQLLKKQSGFRKQISYCGRLFFMITAKLFLALCEKLLLTWQRTVTKVVDSNTKHTTHTVKGKESG